MNRHISRFTTMVRRWFDRGARDRTLDAELESFLQHDIDARIEIGHDAPGGAPHGARRDRRPPADTRVCPGCAHGRLAGRARSRRPIRHAYRSPHASPVAGRRRKPRGGHRRHRRGVCVHQRLVVQGLPRRHRSAAVAERGHPTGSPSGQSPEFRGRLPGPARWSLSIERRGGHDLATARRPTA